MGGRRGHSEVQSVSLPSMCCPKALAKLFQLLRRAGRLVEADKYLKDAARSSPRAPLEAGYKFCEGLLFKYRNDPRSALTALNLARRDGEWGEQAVMLMIEIYLNPENETNWDELVLDERPSSDPGDAVRATHTVHMPAAPAVAAVPSYLLCCPDQ